MAQDGIHRKLTRVRPPHVRVSYDLQVGEMIEREELPFVLEQMNDGVVQRNDPPASLANRRFVDITPDNFERVLESMRPSASASTKNQQIKDSKAGDQDSN